LLDLDPHPKCGSESRRATMALKNIKSKKFSCFEVLDVLF
jgi:glutaredoxin-related protein